MSETDLRFHALISDHAVLQRDAAIPVYGHARPGSEVVVTLDEQRARTLTDASGIWSVTFSPQSAGGSHRIRASSDGAGLEVNDVTFGEVWVGSGQSNMQWTLFDSEGASEEIASANDPDLRVFTFPQIQSDVPLFDCTARWQPATPATAGSFSGVAYFFAKSLRRLGVPVGMIVSAWGGTRIASWIPTSRLDPADSIPPPPTDTPFEFSTELHQDPGNLGVDRGYASPEFDDSDWEEMPVPSYWQQHGHFCNGAAWYRRTIEVPDAWVGRDLNLRLGAIDDFDQTYFSGVKVGAIGPETPNAHAAPRRYRIAGNLVKKRCTIAVRVFDHWGDGGLTGPGGAIRLFAENECDAIALAGNWRFKLEHELCWRKADGASIGSSTLYNAMIHPVTRSKIRGAIWYQGESDVARAERYRELLRRLIGGWRTAFDAPNLAFGVVQLPAYKERESAPADDDWAEVREAQLAALELPDTGMAVTIDLGDALDIHPRRKRAVGARLALWALARVYGQKVEYSGPIATEYRTDGSAYVVRFAHGEGLCTSDGARVRGFQIAGADRRFVWADAVIQGDSVRVSHPEVRAPVATRYAWAANPDANLQNRAGLLASPFRTDRWPGITAGQY